MLVLVLDINLKLNTAVHSRWDNNLIHLPFKRHWQLITWLGAREGSGHYLRCSLCNR